MVLYLFTGARVLLVHFRDSYKPLNQMSATDLEKLRKMQEIINMFVPDFNGASALLVALLFLVAAQISRTYYEEVEGTI